MDVKEYKYILTVVRCGSISHAADELHISQPSLSAYIKNLENKAGIIFFHKVDGVINLTSAGEIYLDYARKIVELDESLSAELYKIQNLDSGEVNIGITATRGTLYLHHILPILKNQFPGIRIRLTETSSQTDLEELLYKHRVDFGFCGYPFIARDLAYEKLVREEIVVTIPSSDSVCKKGRKKHKKSPDEEDIRWIDINLLRDKEFILQYKGQRQRESADTLFSRAGFEPKILFETRSAVTAYNLSAAGMGLSILSSDYCKYRGRDADGAGLNFFSIGAPPLVYHSVLAYPGVATLSNSAAAFIERIKLFFSSYFRT